MRVAMSAESETDLKLEIAHVLTIDVVAYSTLLIHQQSQVIGELTRTVRNTARFRSAEAAGQLTRLPTGDGMALVFFGDPEAPLECAMQISTELKNQPHIRLRMGIHSGPINQVTDVNDHSNVAGAGIDMAQRVMSCGDAGHILVSKRVADDLAPSPRWNGYLHDLGDCEVKHGRKVSLYNFYTSEIGNPEPPCAIQSARGAADRARRRRILSWAVIVALGLLALLVVAIRQRQRPQPFVAVLPLVDRTTGFEQEYLSDGVTEALIRSLGKVPGLLLMSRSASFAFKGKGEDARTIGRRLGVTHVIEGSVTRNAERLFVDAEMILVATGHQVLNERFELPQDELRALPSSIAERVASALGLKIQTEAPPTRDAEAYDLYLQGRYLMNKRSVVSLHQAREFFQRAVGRDPRFALGHSGIADSYILLGEYGAISAGDAADLAWPAVTTALQLDDRLPEGHVSRGLLLTDFEWNWPEAEIAYRRAIELNPNSATAHHWFALHLAQIGKFDEALAEIAAAQRHDPIAPIIWAAKARILSAAGRHAEAIQVCRRALELEPDFGPTLSVLAVAYIHNGRPDEGVSAAEKYASRPGAGTSEKLELAYALAAAGRKAEAEAIVKDATSTTAFPPYDMAVINAALGDASAAITWLEKAIAERSIEVVWIRVDPRLASLHSDDRFEESVAKLRPRGR